MKLILSTIHLTQVAFLEEKSLVRMTSLIMYRQMRGMEIVVNDGVEGDLLKFFKASFSTRLGLNE